MHSVFKKRKQAKLIRLFRRIHRITGVLLLFWFLVLALTGIILGFKKHSGSLLLPETKQGSIADTSKWLSIDSLRSIACKTAQDSISEDKVFNIERIDIRLEMGTAKFIFLEGFIEVQLDCATGEVLNIGRRYSDFIEKLHDGSIVDYYLGLQGTYFKLIYTTIMGLALLVFIFTGFWIWYGSKRIRRIYGKH